MATHNSKQCVSQVKGSLSLASYPGHVGGGKSGLVSTVCTCAKKFHGVSYELLTTGQLPIASCDSLSCRMQKEQFSGFEKLVAVVDEPRAGIC